MITPPNVHQRKWARHLVAVLQDFGSYSVGHSMHQDICDRCQPISSAVTSASGAPRAGPIAAHDGKIDYFDGLVQDCSISTMWSIGDAVLHKAIDLTVFQFFVKIWFYIGQVKLQDF